MKNLTVSLGERSYDIVIGSGSVAGVGDALRQRGLVSRVAVVTNTTVAPLYLQALAESLSREGIAWQEIVIADGECFKNLTTVEQVYTSLIAGGFDRSSRIVALGGGVVGDLAGFAAATYLRGIEFIQVPTTLLAQVDSSVGGKTGVNHELGKNLIGAFHQPKLVVADVATLNTLPQREYLSGLAEVVKYGVVLDADLFSFLEERSAQLAARDEETLEEVVYRCCALKARVVEEDERESGLRAVLNFGHTVGHAIETLTGYREYTHGEAVAIGMIAAASASVALGKAPDGTVERIGSLLRALGLPVDIPPFARERYAETLLRDKKVREGGLTFVCTSGIGAFSLVRISDVDELLSACGIGN